MIRLSLLQFRTQAVIALVTTAAYAVLLAVTGPGLASMYAADGLSSCRGGGCQEMADYFSGSLIHTLYGSAVAAQREGGHSSSRSALVIGLFLGCAADRA